MPRLQNPKYEIYARDLAQGKSQQEAYEAAGFKYKSSSASRLAADPRIKGRIAELVESASNRAEIDIARTLKELVRLGLSDIRQVFDKDGQMLDPRDWPDDFAPAVSSVETIYRPNGDGEGGTDKVQKLKLWDKNSALEKIAKHLNMFVDKMEVTGKDGERLMPEMSDEEVARRAAFLLAKGLQHKKNTEAA